MKFPTLITERLILNKIVLKDSQAIFDLLSDKDVIEYYDLEAFKDISQASNLIKLFQDRYGNSLGIR